MRLPTIDVTTGEVLDVQLSTATNVHSRQGARGRPLTITSQTLNTMRVFLKSAIDGAEKHFDFVNYPVGVREGHQISVVRGRVNGQDETLVLHNHTTGQRHENERAFAIISVQRLLSARWKAFIASTVMFFLGWGMSRLMSSEHSQAYSISWALFFAFLAYPVFWGAAATYDRFMQPGRQRLVSQLLHAEIAERLAPYDRKQEGPAA